MKFLWIASMALMVMVVSAVVLAGQIVKPSTKHATVADLSTGRKTYFDKKLGYTFEYPRTALLNGVGKILDSSTLDVQVDKISSLPDSVEDCAGANDAKARKKELAAGKFPEDQTCWAVQGSEKLVSLGKGVNAIDLIICQEYDNEDVELVRDTMFYIGGYQVDIRSSPDVGKLEDVIPSKYMKYIQANTGKNGAPEPMKVWKDTGPINFCRDISHHKVGGPLQKWYDGYDLMLKSIKVSHK